MSDVVGFLVRHGYLAVLVVILLENLKGGLGGWISSGYPTEPADTPMA